jgi:hypothetical protein
MRSYRSIVFGVLIGAALGPAFSVAQTDPAVPAVAATSVARYSQAQLDQLLAPVALYPDPVLSQLLMASTYPLEVVKAQRWLQQHPGLSGDALDEALIGESWDASVKAIAAFPSVVTMMNDNLDWMQRLGDAFLAQQADVMDTVQALRQKAQAAGTLVSNDRQQIVLQDGGIEVVPTNPYVVYVPVYDSSIVYGPWWWPEYPPFFWWPPSIYGPYDYVMTGFAFGWGIAVGRDHFHGARPDWHGHQIHVRPPHPPGTPHGSPPGAPRPWHHDPAHRGGVPYTSPGVRDRYQPGGPGAVTQRYDYRGYQGPSGAFSQRLDRSSFSVPSPRTLSPLSPESRGSAQDYSSRGHSSLSQPIAAPRPMTQPASPLRPMAQPVAPRQPMAHPVAPPRSMSQPVAPPRSMAQPVATPRSMSQPVAPSRSMSSPSSAPARSGPAPAPAPQRR